MKKTLTLIYLFTIAYINIWAQPITKNNAILFNAKFISNNISQKVNSTQFKPRKELVSNWDVSSSLWIYSDSIRNTYNSQGDIIKKLLYVGSSLNPNKNNYAYNVNNKITSDSSLIWNGSAYIPGSLSAYSYDANGNTTQEIIYNNWTGSAWQNGYKNSFTYDVNNNQIQNISQTWSGSAWVNNYKSDLTWSGGYATQAIDQTWNGTTWENVGKQNYIYTSGQLSALTFFNWNGTSWDANSRINNISWYQYFGIYDPNSKIAEYTEQVINGSLWEDTNRFTFYYDSFGNQTDYIYESITGTIYTTTDKTKNIYQYNSNNSVLVDIQQNWDNALQSTVNFKKREYSDFAQFTTSACVPNQPSVILGNTFVISGSLETYSVASDINATSYIWTLPSGYSGSSTSNSINVTVGAANGIISVVAQNSCGVSVARNLIITVNSPTASSVSMLPVLVKDIATSFSYTDSDPEQFTSFAGKTYFVVKSGATDVPYYTDGTTAGTSALAPNLVLDFCYFLGEFKNRLYFSSSNNSTGMELWSTDGTATGTVLLKDINPSGSSNPTMFTVVGNSLFFAANDGVHGTELWVTDGTEIGTHMTYDMEPSSVPSDGAFVGSGIAFGNSIVFSRLTEPTDRNDLWIMDEFGNVATNLTQQFTALYSVYANATKKILYNNKIYFNFNEGNEGDELFVTDGTVSGTQIFKMISGNVALSPNDFFLFNNKLCFTGFATGIGCCPDLFISDGTLPGTISLNAFAVAPSYAINNNILYFYGGDNTNGYELWKSNGTPSGTNMVKDIRVGGGSSGVNNLSWCAGKLYFTANDGVNQSQPWVSDGTTAGTMMLKNIYSGTNGSYSNNFIEYNSSVFFTARLSFNNFHLFQTNGTTAGTNTIQPIDATNSSNPLGENGSVLTIPTAIKVNNGMIFMKANFHNVGRELYTIGSSQVGIIDLDKLDETYLIYPNPSNGYFKLKSSEHLKNSMIKIYNTRGQIVFETTASIEEIDLSNQPKGMYFMQIKTQNKTVTQKIILQ